MRTLKIICLLLLSVTLFAQAPGMEGRQEEMRQRLESHKIAFITKKVALTPEEAKVFWPVYEEFDDKREALRSDLRPERLSEDLSEEESLKRIKQLLEQDRKMTDLRAKYTEEFLEILSASKVLRLQRAEMEFKREMLKKVRQTMHKGRN